MLSIHNASKNFNHTPVLNGVCMQIDAGSIVGLAGASGGGKTTLLRCIQKLETLDSGSIECDGHIGFMFQDFQLFPHMTVLENLIYAPQFHSTSKNHMFEAQLMLENLGVLEKSKDYPSELSGGQKQRVALARSLMMHPDVLLCDEPTSGLDIVTIHDVVSLLESVRKRGVTMVIASHDLDFLTNMVDRIVVLKNGKIATDVQPHLLSDPVQFLKNYY